MKKKFNIVDAILIILILAALAVSFLFLRSRSEMTAGNTEPMRFTVELKDTLPGTVECVEAAGIGSKVYRSTDSKYLGTLTDFSAVPGVEVEYSQELGRYVHFESEEYVSLYLEITGDGVETASDITVNGLEVKSGQKCYIKGKGYAGEGYIVNVTGGKTPVESTSVGIGDKEIRYVAYIDDIRDFTAESIHVGDHLYDSVSKADLGRIEEVELQPFFEEKPDRDGNPVAAEKYGKYRAVLTLSARCTETEQSYFLDGKFELKIGSKMKCRTKYIESEARFAQLLEVGEAVGG